jgi:large subunit ribosomal protein L9
MAKRVQVVLTKDVSKLGKLGDVVEVAPGYARNFLYPQSFATTVTPGVMKQVARRKELELQRLAELKAAALTQKETLEKIGTLSIVKPVGENEAIFGTVTTQDIVDAIKASAGVDVDRREIEVPEVKSIGEYTETLKLHPEVSVSLTFAVSGS